MDLAGLQADQIIDVIDRTLLRMFDELRAQTNSSNHHETAPR